MKERLVIKNFGPIKSIDLELGKMTILIGEQATGKSTIAKVLAVCRYFSYITDRFENEDSYFSVGLENWGISEYIKENSIIEYHCEHYSLFCESKYGNFDPWIDEEINKIPYFNLELSPKTEKFKELLEEYDNIQKKEYNLNVPTFFYQERIASVLSNPFFIPTERGLQSIFSLGKNSIQNLSDTLFVQLAKLDYLSKSLGKKDIEIEPLGVVYKNVNGDSKIRKIDETEYYSLSRSASGYQSATPIVLAIKYYNERKKNKTFIIEEPEINLFPKAQKKLMEFFAESMNQNNHQFLLPTHSPYILSSLNNLMYAFRVGKTQKEKVNKIVEEKYWVNPEDVKAYRLFSNNSDGTEQENLILEDLQEISIDYLDGVSSEINAIWDKIMEIEFNYETEIN